MGFGGGDPGAEKSRNDFTLFIGYFGAGLALKKAAPRVSLGTLFLAAQLIDLVWPTLLLVGVERVELAPGAKGPPLVFTHYPVTRSLAMVLVWALLFGAVYQFARKYRAGAVVCAVAWACWIDRHRRPAGAGEPQNTWAIISRKPFTMAFSAQPRFTRVVVIS